MGYRSAHALIGYKGKWPPNMRKSRSTAAGVIDVTYTYGKNCPPLPPYPPFYTKFLYYGIMQYRPMGIAQILN